MIKLKNEYYVVVSLKKAFLAGEAEDMKDFNCILNQHIYK